MNALNRMSSLNMTWQYQLTVKSASFHIISNLKKNEMTLRYNIYVIHNISFNNYQYFHTVFALLDNHTMLKGGKKSALYGYSTTDSTINNWNTMLYPSHSIKIDYFVHHLVYVWRCLNKTWTCHQVTQQLPVVVRVHLKKNK